MIAQNLFTGDAPQASPVTVRPYQEECLARIEADMDRGPNRTLIVLATGTGKTTIFSELIRRRGCNTLVIAHQEELLDQAAARIRSMCPGMKVSVEAGSRKHAWGSDVIVAGVQSIGRPGNTRLGPFRPELVITDESHHACADSYQHVYRNLGVYEGSAYHLGVTATPHRLDNKPLHGSEDAIFTEVLFTYTIRDGIKDGYLCDIKGFRVKADGLDLSGVKRTAGDYNQAQLQSAMDHEAVTAVAFNNWADMARERQTVVFCAGVDHALNVAEYWRYRGFKAEAVHGKMDRDQRESVMERFRNGEIQVLTNMQLVTEGVDVPSISSVLLLRPTQSWTLYTQMLGRGLRPAPGKTDCLILDVVGNTERHQLGKHPPASLAGIMGLPPGLDLQGKSAMDALEEFEALDEGIRAALFKRVLTYSQLSSTIQQVDMLGELAIPEELSQVTHMSWIKVADGKYLLECGTDHNGHRKIQMAESTLGVWVGSFTDSTRGDKIELGSDIREAFGAAEQYANSIWDGIRAVADTRSRWRSDRPTEKQVTYLKKYGYADDDIARLNKGQAAQLLAKLFATKKRRTN